MKWFVYNLLFCAVFPFLLPGFLLRMARRGGYRARFGERFALYPEDFPREAGFVWIHAVSVGEVQVAGRLMREWREREPGVRFCFSTTSSTGWKTAEREIGPGDALIYNPLDFPAFVKAAFARISPRAVVLVESELWPNFIRRASKLGVPLYLVNARVSDRSAPRYRMARFFFGDILRRFDRIFAQSALDRDRLLAAGAAPDAVEVTGSFKFDVAARNPAKEEELRKWLARCGVPDGAKTLVGGSTWPGEDAVLLSIYRRLLDEARARGDAAMPALVLAPRHFEKADAVEANILAAGFRCARRSTGETKGDAGETVLLADTTGELSALYSLAYAVFVGKSLCEHGSQNMIEPCLYGKPVAVGPWTENFRPVMSDLLEAEAIVQVSGESELSDTISRWFASGAGGLGARAAAAVERRRGVVAACTKAIVSGVEAARREGRPRKPRHAGGGSIAAALLKGIAFSAAMAAAIFGISAWRLGDPFAAFRTRHARHIEEKPLPRLKAVKTACAFIALVEKPDAAKVLLADKEAEEFRFAFEQVGVKADSAPGGGAVKYDIVFAAAEHSREELARLAGKTAERGLFACVVDVHKATLESFAKTCESFPCPDYRLWMPGARDWVIAGRPNPMNNKMSAMLDFFTRPGAISPDAEEAGCCSLPEIFASYAGSKKDIAAALASKNAGERVRPELFMPLETPDIDWVVPDGLDADIVATLASAIRILQDNRRSIIKAAMLSQDPAKETEAIGMWAKAMKCNPRDTMLLDRLYLLAVNAKALAAAGNFAYAAKCYETMIAIRPADRRVLLEYAKCLDRLGKRGLAAEIRRRASISR